jgi:polyhydroxybutyrate depolymerase
MGYYLKLFYLLSAFLGSSAFVDHTQAKEYAITHNQDKRSFLLRKPIALIGKKLTTIKTPTIIVLHGGSGNGIQAEKVTNFTRKALPKGFMVVYPNGSERFSRIRTGRTWNANHCCGYAMQRNIDDIGFINTLIDNLIQNHNADPSRIYVTGMSNGAMLTHLVGIHLSDRIAAIAPLIGGMFGDETPPSMTMPALIINGAKDDVIRLEGGTLGLRMYSRGYDRTPFMPSLYQAQFWAHTNRCDPDYTTRNFRNGALTAFAYDCPSQANVVYYVVNDGAHSWPGGNKSRRGGDEPSNAIDATRVIIDFFSKH